METRMSDLRRCMVDGQLSPEFNLTPDRSVDRRVIPLGRLSAICQTECPVFEQCMSDVLKWKDARKGPTKLWKTPLDRHLPLFRAGGIMGSFGDSRAHIKVSLESKGCLDNEGIGICEELGDDWGSYISFMDARDLADFGVVSQDGLIEVVDSADGGVMAFPSHLLARIVNVLTGYVLDDGGALTKAQLKELGLSSNNVLYLNDRVQWMVGERLFNVSITDNAGKPLNKYVPNRDVLKRLADFSKEVYALPATNINADKVGEYKKAKRDCNSFLQSTEGRYVDFVFRMEISTTLVMRTLLENYEHSDAGVDARRRQLIYCIDRHLSAWGLTTKASRARSDFVELVFGNRDNSTSRPKGGACAGVDPELFYPDRGESTQEPKGVCGGCKLRTGCLEYAIANRERYGVWGGTSQRERRALIAERNKAENQAKETDGKNIAS